MSYFKTQSKCVVFGITFLVTCWLAVSNNRVEANYIVEVESTSVSAGGVKFTETAIAGYTQFNAVMLASPVL